MDHKINIYINDGFSLSYNELDMCCTISTKTKVWRQDSRFKPYFEAMLGNNPVKFILNDAQNISVEQYSTGLGQGIRTRYANWSYKGDSIPFSFETLIWIDTTYNDLHMEIIPLYEGDIRITRMVWPTPFEFKSISDEAYSVIPMTQGCIIPNNWPEKVEAYPPTTFYGRAAYMPWWGQIEDRSGYIAIAETPWDGGYELEHPKGGPTRLNAVWHASLGNINYARKMKYTFIEDCDYNTLCKVYREYIKHKGQLITLEEKAIRNKNVDRLIGSPIIHTKIYTHIKPESLMYKKDDLAANEEFHMFSERTSQLKKLKEKGVETAYVHLDGWGKMGYDNMHPDILPPCDKAGGWEGMKILADTCRNMGYIFATHDQYRDYYTDAETYDESQTIHDINGEIPGESTWDGGEQSYLCTKFAPDYVKRNFESLKRNGVQLEGTYLDVFSVIELDECFHHEHKMTRKECMEKRIECFEYVRGEGIISSSEETVDWAVPHIELCHHAPYPVYAHNGYAEPRCILVPLFNLVYHECIVVPWELKKHGWDVPHEDDGFLYALLNGGTGYLDIEADQEEIKRNKIVCELHKRVGKQEMLKHEFIEGDYRRQRTIFADGTVVEINLDTEEYYISHK